MGQAEEPRLPFCPLVTVSRGLAWVFPALSVPRGGSGCALV